MAGLLDFMNTPAGMGLLSAVAGGMAGARRGQPISSIGRGLVTGIGGYQDAQQQIRADEENVFAKKYKSLQMQELVDKMAKDAAQKTWRAGLPGVTAPQLTGVTDQSRQLAAQQETFGPEAFPALLESAEYADPDAPLNMYYGVNQPAVDEYIRRPESPFADELNKRQMLPEIEKPQLVTVYGADGVPMQKWVRPGESTGTDVGRGKPEAGASPYGQDLREWLAVNGIDPRTATPQQLQAAYTATNQQKDSRARAGGVSITNSPQLGPKYTEGVDKLGATYLFDQFGEARNAATAVAAVNDARTLLNQGMFTGKTGPWQESVAGWYQSATGRPMPKLDATQQFKTVIGDIVLPALANMKGASSDRDFMKIEEYSRGEATMTEAALRNHLNRLFNKYGTQINNFNTTLDDYQKSGGASIPGLRRLESPAGNIKNTPTDQKAAYQEYIDAYNSADTPDKKRAITERARSNGVVK